MNKTVEKDEILFAIREDDVQDVAIEKLGRKLTNFTEMM